MQCMEVDLVLNCEKCHFMINSGIVLGHRIFEVGIEMDQAKLAIIRQLTFS